jgi:hypothetical protein
MGKVEDLRAMRERNYEARLRAATEEEGMATRTQKRTARKAASRKVSARKVGTNGEHSVGINIGIRRPMTARNGHLILSAAADAMLAGATLEQVVKAIEATAPKA